MIETKIIHSIGFNNDNEITLIEGHGYPDYHNHHTTIQDLITRQILDPEDLQGKTSFDLYTYLTPIIERRLMTPSLLTLTKTETTLGITNRLIHFQTRTPDYDHELTYYFIFKRPDKIIKKTR